MHTNSTIVFIGGGNMASCLISGLIASGYDSKSIWATDPSPDKLQHLHQTLGIHTTENNEEGVRHADVLVLAVKPQVMHQVLAPLTKSIQERKPLIISIAAMITAQLLQKWLGGTPAIVRCMPNTPALIGCGATGLYANTYVTSEQRDTAESLMRAVGITIWLDDENKMDVVTALSGSGPAYFFFMMEALQQAAETMGLTKDAARLLVLQTALGAAKLAMESDKELEALRKQVTSPGGTTERAIEVLEEGRFRELFLRVMQAAEERARDVAKGLETS